MSKIHLSQLKLNINSRDVRRDISDPYDMHRSICRAALAASDVLHPFLWRQEIPEPCDAPVLLVQSESELDWNALPDDYLVGLNSKTWSPDAMKTGHRVRFRVKANPTVKKAPAGHEGPARGYRKRFGLNSSAEQLEWINRQFDRIGLGDSSIVISSSGVIKSHRKAGHKLNVCVAQFDGEASIVNPDNLATALRKGIGHARMLGLGLISLAPLRLP